MKIRVIGVTGIFASGKGTVCSMFEDLGAKIIDTDEIAREVVEPGSIVLGKLVREFGDDILSEDGSLDRLKLAGRVFSYPGRVRRLNELTHPEILERTIVIIESNPDNICMVNTPLLFESGFDKFMDRNIVVTAKTEQAIERGVKRDKISEEEIRDRLKNQNSLNDKVKKADYVIDNSGSLENTKRQVMKIWRILMKGTEA